MIPQISPATAAAAAPSPPPGQDGSGQAFADLLDEPVEQPLTPQPTSSDLPADPATPAPADAGPMPAAETSSQAPLPPDQPDVMPDAPISDGSNPFADDKRDSPANQPDQSLAERLFAAMEFPNLPPAVAGAAVSLPNADTSENSGDPASSRTGPAPGAYLASPMMLEGLSNLGGLQVDGAPTTGQFTAQRHGLAQPSLAGTALTAPPSAVDAASAQAQTVLASSATGSALATNLAQGTAGVMVRQLFSAPAPTSAEAAVLLRANFAASGPLPPSDATAPAGLALEIPDAVPETPQITRTTPPLHQDIPAGANDQAIEKAVLETPFLASPMIDSPRGGQAATSAMPTPSAPLPAPTIPALVHAISQTSSGTVDLVLTPEDLGRLRFEVTQNGDQIRIHLTVERPDTLDMLRRNSEQMLAEFRQAGYAGATLSFAQSGHGGQRDNPSPHASAQTAPAAERDPLPQTPQTYQTGAGLDLRL